jgi:hypothetical protein
MARIACFCIADSYEKVYEEIYEKFMKKQWIKVFSHSFLKSPIVYIWAYFACVLLQGIWCCRVLGKS